MPTIRILGPGDTALDHVAEGVFDNAVDPAAEARAPRTGRNERVSLVARPVTRRAGWVTG
jgi:hypothetical protein